MGKKPDGDPRGMNVGGDIVSFEEDIVVILARREFPDWQVRGYCRHPIFFRQRKYFLRDKRPIEMPFAFRYELQPWPANLHEESNRSFTYSESAVAVREETVREEKKRDFIWYALLPIYPLLGFCWSGFKERVLQPLGFVPIYITSASTMLTFCLAFVDAMMFIYFGGGVLMHFRARRLLPGMAHVGWMDLVDLMLILALAADCAVRYSQVLRHDAVPDGFFEWFFRMFKSKDGTRDE